jgi:hypothetical protein
MTIQTAVLIETLRHLGGAPCPSDDVSSLETMLQAYSLVLSKGLIRIGLPMQSSIQFQILSVDDPYGCNTNPITKLDRSAKRHRLVLSAAASLNQSGIP